MWPVGPKLSEDNHHTREQTTLTVFRYKRDPLPMYIFIVLLLGLLGEHETVRCELVEMKPCPACGIPNFMQFKDARQEELLGELMRKLDLESKPNVSVDYSNLPLVGRFNPRVRALIDESMRESLARVKRSSGMEAEVEPPATNPALYEVGANPVDPPELSFIAGKKASDPVQWDISSDGDTSLSLFYFKLSPILRKKYVIKAVLNILLSQLPPAGRRSATDIEVYERLPDGSASETILTSKHLPAHLKASAHISLTLDASTVQEWLSEGRNIVRLYIKIIRSGNQWEDDHHHDVSLHSASFELSLYDIDEQRVSRGRNRRHSGANVCQAEQNQTKCCLYDLVIDFQKVGWEFVVAPKRYNAFVCNGECSTNQMATSARGSIAQQANLDYYQCCHPKEYAGITIVYVTEGNQIWIKEFTPLGWHLEVPGMVAKRCGCA